MHAWFKFFHVLAVFAFLLSHGVSVSIAFALKRETELERVKALLELSGNSYRGIYLSLYALLGFGVVAGFTGKWWGEGWIWVSIVLLIAMIALMGIFGGGSYGLARKLAGLPYAIKGKHMPAEPPAPRAELDAVLAKANPMRLAIIGYGGLTIIAWLMMFKPF
ncbi:MAG: hypothetical protein H6636_10470 [Anaerolineales bacterium]|nr:hypothetical protein [Anaerolineales bacterium]